MKTIIAIAALAMLGGCASTTAQIQQEMYSQRIAEQSKIKQTEANAEIERYKTARELKTPEAQLAFTISEGIASALRASGAGKASDLPPMPVIEGWDDKLLRGLSIFAPVAGNVALGVVQSQSSVKIAKFNTEANTRIAESRDKAETDRLIAAGKANVDIAGKIQAPPGTNNYIGGDGVIGGGTINKTNITTVNNCPTGDTGNATATPSGTATPSATANGGTTGATVCNGK